MEVFMRRWGYVLVLSLFFGVIFQGNCESAKRGFYSTGCIPHLDNPELQKSFGQIQETLSLLYEIKNGKPVSSQSKFKAPKEYFVILSSDNYTVLKSTIGPDLSFSLFVKLKEKGKILCIVYLNSSKTTAREATLTFKQIKGEGVFNLSIPYTTAMMVELGKTFEKFKELLQQKQKERIEQLAKNSHS
jgi:hypothetical protein